MEGAGSSQLALAARFGGGLVARLAAAQALQSRQASAEPTEAAASREASQLTPREPAGAAAAAPAAAEPPADDEALLLSGLLNAGGGSGTPARLLLPRRSMAIEAAAAASCDSEDASAERPLSGGQSPSAEQPLPGGRSPSAASAGGDSWASRSSSARSSLDGAGMRMAAGLQLAGPQAAAYGDAADEDTVLTGSPVTICCSLPEAAPAEPGEHPQLLQAPQQPPQQQHSGASQASASHQRPLPPPPPEVQRLTARGSGPPRKQALRQQLWSFGAIPAGTACIPSSKPAAAAPGDGDAKGSGAPVHGAPPPGRPAFYTRAASPPPRSPSGLQAPAAAAPQCGSRGAAQMSRRQRLEQLAQPKRRATPVHSHRQQPARQGAAATAAAGCSWGAAAGQDGALPRRTLPGAAGTPKKAAAPPALAPPRAAIAAWRPAGAPEEAPSAAAACVAPPSQPPPAAADDGGQRLQWPQRLGQQPEGGELQVATGAYSEERFQAHFACLTATLQRGAQRRRQQADALAAGVTEFVAAVQGLGTGSGGGGCGSSEGTGKPAAAATEAAADPPVLEQQSEQQQQPLDAPPAVQMLQRQGIPASPATAGPASGLAPSPTQRLLQCRHLLQARPQTAPCSGGVALPGDVQAEEGGRPASCSPHKIKPLMQVKGEQDRALQALAAASRPFRAAPLPLSTMEPRFERQLEQEQALRQAAHQRRRRQLLEAQRPFGFEAAAAERAQRRRLVHGQEAGAAEAGAGERPATPTFRALPVPMSTVEARYALLAAELQLQNRTVKGRGLASPPRRPATAAAAPRCRSPGRGSAASPHAPTLQRPQTSLVSVLSSMGDFESPSPGGCRAAAAGDSSQAVCDSSPAETPCPQPALQEPAAAGPAPEAPAEAAAEAEASYSCCFSAPSSSSSLAGTAAAADAEPASRPPGESLLDDAAAAGSGDADIPAAVSQASLRDVAAEEPHLSASPGGTPVLQPGPEPGCAAAASREQLGAAASDAHQPAGPRLPAVGTTHSQHLRLQSLQYAQAAGQYATAAERAGWDASDKADAALLRRSAMQLPPQPPAREATAAAVAASKNPVVQRLGSRASSCGGEPAAAATSGASDPDGWLEEEAGIAVPVCLLPAGAASGSGGAAGVGAELVPGGFHLEAGSSSSPEKAAAAAAGSDSPGERRRDTPPQHIAARHAQAAAAARREVREALERRGGGVARLVLGA